MRENAIATVKLTVVFSGIRMHKELKIIEAPWGRLLLNHKTHLQKYLQTSFPQKLGNI